MKQDSEESRRAVTEPTVWQLAEETAVRQPLPGAIADDPLLAEAYRAAAEQNVLRALNPQVFFGYSSVRAHGKGHGHNTTYPGLDWGQSAEALLWLGRKAEVFASWDYVKGFQREDGLLPFAILPDLAGMGRVWYLECWARARMGDRAGLLHSLRKVAAVGKANHWSWMERYYSEKTGDLGQYHFQYYCEYPASFIRVVNRFVANRASA